MQTEALNKENKSYQAVVVRSFRIGPFNPAGVERQWSVESWSRSRTEQHVDFRPLKLQTGPGKIEYDKRRSGPSIVIGPHPEYRDALNFQGLRAITEVEKCTGRYKSGKLRLAEIGPFLLNECPDPVDLQDSLSALTINKKVPALVSLEDPSLPNRLAFEVQGLRLAADQAKMVYGWDKENIDKKEAYDKAKKALEAKEEEIRTLPERKQKLRFEILLEHMRIRNRHPEGMVISDDLRWGMTQIGRLGDEQDLENMIFGSTQRPRPNSNPTQSQSGIAGGASASGSSPRGGSGSSPPPTRDKAPFTAGGPTQKPKVIPGTETASDFSTPEGRADLFRNPENVKGMVRTFLAHTVSWQVLDGEKLKFNDDLRSLPSMIGLESAMRAYEERGGQTPQNAEKIYLALVQFKDDASRFGYQYGQ